MTTEQVEMDPCDCLCLFFWTSSVGSLTVCETALTQTRQCRLRLLVEWRVHACAKPRVPEEQKGPQTNNVQLFPTSETLGERSRKEGEDSEKEKSKSVVSAVGVSNKIYTIFGSGI